MNTLRSPREILLARHSTSSPALDAQRAALLARFATPSSATPSAPQARTAFAPLSWFAVLHRELFAPYRRAWSALACVWIALLAIQQLDRLSAPDRLVSSPPTTPVGSALFALWIEQRRCLAELGSPPFGSPPHPTTSAQRSSLPAPAAAHPLGVVIPTLAAPTAIV